MRHRRIVVLLLALIALVLGLITGRELLFTIFYLLSLLLVIAFAWAWININWVHLGRVTRTRRTQVGRPLEERFTVRNTSVVPKLWLEIRDHSTVPGHRASQVVSNLSGRSTDTWRVNTICKQRGRYQLGPITISSSDPFGLFPMQRELPATANVVVYPRTVEIEQFGLPVGILPGGDALRRRTHYITTNAAGVRDYAPGDSFSRIHWPSTARRNRLIVKEFELDPLADIWLVPDMSVFGHIVPRPSRERAREDEHLPPWLQLGEYTPPETTEEYTVTATASLAQYFLRRDRAVALMAYGQSHEILQPDRGERQLNRILETLAVLRAQGQIPLDDLLRAEMQLLPRGTTLIVVTPTTSQRWPTTARMLVRRGLRVVTVLVDPASFGGPRSAAPIATALQGNGLAAYMIGKGDDIGAVLGQGRVRASYYAVA